MGGEFDSSSALVFPETVVRRGQRESISTLVVISNNNNPACFLSRDNRRTARHESAMRLSATSHTHIHAHRTHTKATSKHFQQRSHQKRSPCSHRRPVSMLAHIPSARILSRLHATNTTAPLLRRTRLTKRLPTRQAGISSLTCRVFGFAGVQACPRVGQQLQGGASGSLMAWLAEERVGVRERDVSSFKSCMEASPSLPEILQQATPLLMRATV